MRVFWTSRAARDLTSICDFTAERAGPEVARRVALLIYTGAGSLRRFPQRGRPGRRPETRELAIGSLPYLIVYRVRGTAAEVLRILHSAQRWPLGDRVQSQAGALL